MKLFFFIFLLLLCNFKTYAQENTISIKGYNQVEDFFNDKISKQRKDHSTMLLLDSLCINGCSFLTFQINKTGEIFNINVDNNTPKLLKEVLIQICSLSNKSWSIDETIMSDSIVVVIPIMYNFFTLRCTPVNRYFASLQSMMSTFGSSTKGSLDGIERGKIRNVYLGSPILFQSSFY